MTTGWSDASGWQITLPTAQDLAAEIGAYTKGQQFKREETEKQMESPKPMTATEVVESRNDPKTWNNFNRYLEEVDKKIFEAFASIGLRWCAKRRRATCWRD